VSVVILLIYCRYVYITIACTSVHTYMFVYIYAYICLCLCVSTVYVHEFCVHMCVRVLEMLYKLGLCGVPSSELFDLVQIDRLDRCEVWCSRRN